MKRRDDDVHVGKYVRVGIIVIAHTRRVPRARCFFSASNSHNIRVHHNAHTIVQFKLKPVRKRCQVLIESLRGVV
jgi:hypothetical protein